MVEFIPDPENTYVLIPRFEDAKDMGDYCDEKNYEGRCAVSAEIVQSNANPGETYIQLYKETGTIDPVTLTLLVVGAIVLAICMTIMMYFLSIIAATVVTAFKRPGLKLHEINGTALIECPDGSTFGVDKETKKIVFGEPCTPWEPPIESTIKWVVIGAIAIGGLIIGSILVKDLLKKKKGGT